MALRRSILIALLALVSALICTQLTWADSQARIVRLSYIDGNAQIDRGDGPENAVLNMPIVAGMTVLVPAGIHAEIEFENGSTMRLVGGTQAAFDQLLLRDSGAKVDQIRLDQGVSYFNFRNIEGKDEIRFAASGETFRVRKSSRFRVQITPQEITVAVYSGKLELEGGPKPVEIGKGETLSLNVSDRTRYAVDKNIMALDSDAWDKQREEEMGQYASTKHYRGYGASDLNHYGTYVRVPDYGWGWRPYGVTADWDPFANGTWVWYPSFGWVWVSSDPWGWAPYRYGHWAWVNGLGWYWVPGGGGFGWGWPWSWNTGPTFIGYVPPIYIAPAAPRPLNPDHGHRPINRRPPDQVVVGNPAAPRPLSGIDLIRTEPHVNNPVRPGNLRDRDDTGARGGMPVGTAPTRVSPTVRGTQPPPPTRMDRPAPTRVSPPTRTTDAPVRTSPPPAPVHSSPPPMHSSPPPQHSSPPPMHSSPPESHSSAPVHSSPPASTGGRTK